MPLSSVAPFPGASLPVLSCPLPICNNRHRTCTQSEEIELKSNLPLCLVKFYFTNPKSLPRILNISKKTCPIPIDDHLLQKLKLPTSNGHRQMGQRANPSCQVGRTNPKPVGITYRIHPSLTHQVPCGTRAPTKQTQYDTTKEGRGDMPTKRKKDYRLKAESPSDIARVRTT